MYNPNDEGPVSPMKKLKILSEKHQNVISKPNELLQTIKEKHVDKEKDLDNIEPLLEEGPGQYVIFPINHQDMWQMYKELVGNFWSVTETLQQLDNLLLEYDEKQYMKLFSSIFASPDSKGLVNDNLAEEFCKLVQITEAKFFFGHQLFVQNIHYEMYNKLLDSFVANNDEKMKLFKIVENYDAVANKRKWIAQWKHSSFAIQLLAASCLHGLMFCSLDLTCEWLKKRVKNPFSHELVDILEKMVRDQELQRDFACLMINHLKSKPSKEKMLETINQAARIEFDFIINGIQCELIGVGTDEVIQLIDRKTKALKQKLFNTNDDKKKANSESDRKVNEEYQKNSKENNQNLCLDEDF